jgi:hypothetical protein
MYWLTISLLLPSLCAASTTTVSLFLANDLNRNGAPAAKVTGSVLAVNKTATTYVIDCIDAPEIQNCGLALTVTAAPSWEILSYTVNNLTASQSCTFTASTEGTCDYQIEGDGLLDNGRVIYPAKASATLTASISSGSLSPSPGAADDESNRAFPGFQEVLITAGAEKLISTPTSTSVSKTATGTASPTPATSTKASQGVGGFGVVGSGHMYAIGAVMIGLLAL